MNYKKFFKEILIESPTRFIAGVFEILTILFLVVKFVFIGIKYITNTNMFDWFLWRYALAPWFIWLIASFFIAIYWFILTFKDCRKKLDEIEKTEK